ncbi:MAG: hypothetical protein KC505_06175 [Myxococcales bacterium]|nr:hypothetical protein [Myxococcales bacterium]USN51860.1 MAG: hypothetical protein H6731_05485 [Myxococcales bacterium]
MIIKKIFLAAVFLMGVKIFAADGEASEIAQFEDSNNEIRIVEISCDEIKEIMECATEFQSEVYEEQISYSKKVGACYLWGRIFEYIFYTASISTLMLAPEQSQNILASLILATIGKASGEIGNIFQAYQGIVDLKNAHQFPKQAIKNNKKKFAILAIARGSINLLSDTCGLVAFYYENIPIALIALIAGGVTDVLGAYKNFFDTKRNKSLKKFAYFSCLSSRAPFIGACITGCAETLGLYSTRLPSRMLSLIGYLFFDSGALMRQHLYHSS